MPTRNSKAGSGFGSGELDLLAGGASPSPAAAAQPYFQFARFKAAEAATKPQDRVELLMDAIAIDPKPVPPRLLLVSAALDIGNPQIAWSAIDPLIGYFRYTMQRTDAMSDSEMASETGAFLTEVSDTAARASLERALAKASVQLGELRQAILLYRMSLELQPSSDVRAEFDQAKAEQARRTENTRRRPVLKQDLGQDRLVEPSLAQGGSSK